MEYSGKDIKALRKVLKMNQTEFGEAVGVSKLSVINWELGKTEIRKESVKEKIQELMQQNNLANADEIFNNVEIMGYDSNNGVMTVNLPYETFEPGVFYAVLEKFILNPDINKEDKMTTLRNIRRVILDFEDGKLQIDEDKHIWPDSYIEKRSNPLLSMDAKTMETEQVAIDGDIKTYFVDISNIAPNFNKQNGQNMMEIDKKISNGEYRIDDIFNLSYLPSYVNIKAFVIKMNQRLCVRRNIISLCQLAVVVAKHVMGYEESNALNYSMRPPELDEFFENFGEQLSKLGLTTVEIKKVFISCRYISTSELDEYIKSGEASISDLVLIDKFIENKYLTEADVRFIERELKRGRLSSAKDLYTLQDNLIVKSFLNENCSAIDAVYFWLSDGLDYKDLISNVAHSPASEKYLFAIEFAYLVYELERNNKLSTKEAFDIVFEAYHDAYISNKDKQDVTSSQLLRETITTLRFETKHLMPMSYIIPKLSAVYKIVAETNNENSTNAEKRNELLSERKLSAWEQRSKNRNAPPAEATGEASE